MNRRHFLATIAASAAASPSRAADARPPRILLRSSWQTVNIGDIAHTPGALRLFAKHLPEAEITLWPNKVDRGVKEQLQAAFPSLRFVGGEVDAAGQPTSPSLAAAFAESDLLVHGSGPNVMAWSHLLAWRKTGKPYGFFGITFDPLGGGAGGDWEGGTLTERRQRLDALPVPYPSEDARSVFAGASFNFFRDTFSLEYVKRHVAGLRHAEFGPDATFACDLRDDAKAATWLSARGLEDKKFICVIPRLRWTPYHTMHGTPATDGDRMKDAVNARTRAADHAGLREMIIQWVRTTGLKVLVCPEMTYQIEVGKEELYDPLPDDVKSRVVLRDTYWLNTEATSVYRQALAVVSMENHSPILALAQGTPVVFIRQPTDTIKGQMWRDLNLGDWFLEVEDATGAALWSRLAAIHGDPARAAEKAGRIHQQAMAAGRHMVETVGRVAKA